MDSVGRGYRKSGFGRALVNVLGWLFSLGFTLFLLGGGALILVFNYYSKDLPDYSQLEQYDPPTVTRLYAGDGKLLAEYATEKRIFVPLSAIPQHVRDAFLSAEDKNFYQHEGVDFTGLLRAVRNNIINYGQGRSLVGGSTITQQVVKNFLLTNEKSIERKIKEAILATRISHVYSKDKILELYLNEIYLGLGSYGVAAAAQNYFNKSLDDLTLEEAALLAAQPKGPALYDPRRSYDAAKERRDWVLERMHEDKRITPEEFAQAKETPITLRKRDAAEVAHADFFAEEVRRTLSSMYGSNVLYEGGLVVKTTLNPELQRYADAALRRALVDYDRRRGYRGPITHLATFGARQDDWREQINKLMAEQGYQLIDQQKLALVTQIDDRKATITFADDVQGIVPQSLLKWTRRVIADGKLGPEIRKPSDILKVGDVIIVGPISDEQKKLLSADDQKKAWDLQQVPEVNGAMVVLDPHTGRVLAMSGGYAYGGTEFNRATQAKRQPGSVFKPFVYLTALENGYTPSTVLMDAPVELSQGVGLPTWKPQNYHDDYLGPITMRVGLEKSRNTVTVRMAQVFGIDKVIAMAKRCGIYDEVPRNFSIVLGAAEVSLLRITNAYGILDNGGKRIKPSLIERIDDRHGKTIYRRDTRLCKDCTFEKLDPSIMDVARPPIPEDDREQIIDPRLSYQMVSMLHGVTVRGTAAKAHVELKHIVAGKTGTTNDSNDTWFIGFSPDLVAGVYIGFDKPRTLGKKETGGSVALPAFISFMKQALADEPNKPFRIPRGIQLMKVNLATGQPAGAGEEGRIIDEAFVTGGPLFVPGVSGPYKSVSEQAEGAPKVAGGNGQEGENEGEEETEEAVESVPAAPVVGTGALY